MDSVPKGAGEDSRSLIEGDQVVELAFRDADFRYTEICENVSPTSVVLYAQRPGMPFIAVVFDGDVRVGPEQVGAKGTLP